jgi:hypothetical protein
MENFNQSQGLWRAAKLAGAVVVERVVVLSAAEV